MDAIYNEKGQEIPDNTPVALPLGARNPESLQQMITRLVRVHSEIAVKEQLESLDEADDFETGEEEPVSQFQMTDMQEENLQYKPSILKTDQTEKPPAPAERPPAPAPATFAGKVEPAAALKPETK